MRAKQCRLIMFAAWSAAVMAMFGSSATGFGQDFSWDKVLNAGRAYIENDEQGRRWHAVGAYQRQQELQKEIRESKRLNDIDAYHHSLDNAELLLQSSRPFLAIETFTDGFLRARDASVTIHVGTQKVTEENIFPRSDDQWRDMQRVPLYKKADKTYGEVLDLFDKLDAQADADLSTNDARHYLWHEMYHLALLDELQPATTVSSDFERTFVQDHQHETDRLAKWKNANKAKDPLTLIASASALTDWSHIIELYLAGRQKEAAPLIREAILNGGSETVVSLGNFVRDGQLKGLTIAPFPIDSVDAGGRAITHLAVAQNDPVALQLFLALGADPTIKDRAGKTATDLIPYAKKELFTDYTVADGWKDSEFNRKLVDPRIRTLARWIYACANSSPFPSATALNELESAWADVYLNRISGNEQFRKASVDAGTVLVALNLQFLNKMKMDSLIQKNVPTSKVAAKLAAIEKLKTACAKNLNEADDAAASFSVSFKDFEASLGADGKAAVQYAKAEGKKDEFHDKATPDLLR